jgi:hypothetical protein
MMGVAAQAAAEVQMHQNTDLSGNRTKNCLRPLRWRLRPSAYELLSICARSSAIEPNFTVPCGNLASIDPSL